MADFLATNSGLAVGGGERRKPDDLLRPDYLPVDGGTGEVVGEGLVDLPGAEVR
jgi:hypothetical protein